jgi:hypothetical protein
MARPRNESGSALVLALLVAFVLSLLGVSFLLMAQTESRIAGNERFAAQTLYVAEAGARMVHGWFERPGTAFGSPPDDPAIVIRNREILDEDDPYGAGTVIGPHYKEDIDVDGVTGTDLFVRPYRGTLEDTLMGKESAPDMRIEDPAFLEQLTTDLLGDFASTNATIRPRLERIDIYAPPYVPMGDNWLRHGIATVKVVAGMYRTGPMETGRKLAEKTVVMVLNEVPYGTPVYGPIHTCGDLNLVGKLRAHWGAVTATGDVFFDTVDMESIPRGLQPGPRVDRLWTNDPAWIADFNANPPNEEISSDPWLRLVSRGALIGGPDPDSDFECSPPADEPRADLALEQPCPPQVPALGSGETWTCCDHSGILQNQTLVGCPEYDYRFWKRLATSGVRGARYFVWVSGDEFSENGVGPTLSFSQIFATANGEPALYFFDTMDRRPPTDDTGDGTYDNLTPDIEVTGSWRARGFIYLNAENFRSDGLSHPPPLTTLYQAPGEPILESGDAWIDLVYPTNTDDRFRFGGPPDWAPQGPAFNGTATFHGILYTSGTFVAVEGGIYYGSVIARSGATLNGAVTPIAAYYWDPGIHDRWPPVGWDLPRVFASRVDLVP